MILLFAFSSVASASNLTNETPTPTPTLTPTPFATPKPAVPRQIVKETTIIHHHWVLYQWQDNKLVCKLFMDTADEPSQAQIIFSCGEAIALDWTNTHACTTPDEPENCEGLFLKYLGEFHSIIEETIIFPPPSVEVGLVNCNPWGDCPGAPRLSFTGIEPLENETITLLHILVGEKEFKCVNNPCVIEMPTTEELGVRVAYWADSSYGDHSHQGRFMMRYFPLPKDRYQFELLGYQWADSAPPCALAWQTFPELEIGEIPWLKKVEDVSSLTTDHPYTWLGGLLITKGEVDARECADNGLLLNGAASTCGMEVAEQALIDWQNQYDEQIFNAAVETNLPANLLKGLIAQETQFYAQRAEKEYGLGMLTEEGFDMLFTWNIPYFLERCEPLYGEECAWGYDHQGEYHQDYLHGIAYREIGTENEIPLIANTLYAACGQAGQLVKNITQKAIQETMQYSDLWQLTLGVYHAGSGCIGNAIEKAWDADLELTWETVGNQLEPDCDLAQVYVQNVIYFGMP